MTAAYSHGTGDGVEAIPLSGRRFRVTDEDEVTVFEAQIPGA